MSDRPDSLGLAAALAQVPERTELAMLAAQDAALPSAEDATAIVVVGNGAAGFAARVVAHHATNVGTTPVVAVVDGHLPNWVGRQTLVVIIDHHEARALTAALVAEAHVRGATVVACAVRGAVASQVDGIGGTVVELASSAPVARVALGALVAAPLVVLDRLAFLPGLEPALDHAVAQLHHRRDAIAASGAEVRSLARKIGRSIPLICGGDELGALAASRWKMQCNANAKIPAFASSLPALAFDEVSGWGQHGDVTRQVFTSVLLRHDYETVTSRSAFDRLVPLLEESLLNVHTVVAEGTGPLAQLLDLAYVGDAVSIELALAESLDPGPAPGLDALL